METTINCGYVHTTPSAATKPPEDVDCGFSVSGQSEQKDGDPIQPEPSKDDSKRSESVKTTYDRQKYNASRK